MLYIFIYIIVLIFLHARMPDLSGKRPHRQVGLGRMVMLGSLGGVMVSTLAHNKRCGFNSHPRCTIYHFHHPLSHDTGSMTRILCKLNTIWLLNVPCVL